MSNSYLVKFIHEFSPKTLDRFMRDRSTKFRTINESLEVYEDGSFSQGLKVGQIDFDAANQLIVCIFKTDQTLAERSGKKAQYDLAKKILKDTQDDAGIFVFYDAQGNFRFSLVFFDYQGRKRQDSPFKRFTYFVSPQLTNKTFLQRIGEGDFSTLEAIKESFSVEKVTKDFYQEISYWYFWACQKCQFPKDAETETNGRQISVIRLITRLIFVWFMREKKLVPTILFEKQELCTMLNDLDDPSSSYYLAILQNLFFATLNTKISERQFRSEVRGLNGHNPDFGNHNKYRHQNLFTRPEKMQEYFANIPFLNGGLFDCLDEKENSIYIDGYSDTKKNQPLVPNELFFSGEKAADFNVELGTSNHDYKVKGLFEILSAYNFTIDENTVDDKDVALDPELLGRVFENLLASFNPETSTTARKATGSYYTPREIVDYMVDESLKAYFKTHLVDVADLEEKLSSLFSLHSDENPFDAQQSKKVVGLVENVRIVDPAVGSGAFPMGALNKLVFILSKVDKGNQLWKQAQLAAADQIPDGQLRAKVHASIEAYFREKNPDYGRKLYLIQKCIFGVDIQQIAVEIAKLRFFISLLVEETIEKDKENWGIEPLPNLDFKIMQGNSLISEYLGIRFTSNTVMQADNMLGIVSRPYSELINAFELKKNSYQSESDRDLKISLRNEIEDLLINIFIEIVKEERTDYFHAVDAIKRKYEVIPNLKSREEGIAIEIEKIKKRMGFDLEEAEKQLRQFNRKRREKPFFPWDLYFAEVFQKGGFDIAIANPPYVSSWNMGEDLKEYFLKNFKAATGHYDLYILFLEQSMNILKSNGVLCFITSNKYLSQNYGFGIRELFLKNTILSLLNFKGNIFDATVDTSIITIKKVDQEENKIKILEVSSEDILVKKLDTILGDETLFFEIRQDKFGVGNEKNFRTNVSDFDYLIKRKIDSQSVFLGDFCYVDTGVVPHSSKLGLKKDYFMRNSPQKDYKVFLEGRNVFRWQIVGCSYLNYQPELHHRPKMRELFEREKIIMRRVVGSKGFFATYEPGGSYVENGVILFTLIKNLQDLNYVQLNRYLTSKAIGLSSNFDLRYVLAIVNSMIVKWYFNKFFFDGLHIYPEHIRSFPIKKIHKFDQLPFIDLVEKILAVTKDSNYLKDVDKVNRVCEYENQIDQLTYVLYGLSIVEIQLINK